MGCTNSKAAPASATSTRSAAGEPAEEKEAEIQKNEEEEDRRSQQEAERRRKEEEGRRNQQEAERRRKEEEERRNQQVPEQAMGRAAQAEGHAEVVLRDAAQQGQILAMVPNGDSLKILQKQGDSLKVQWKEIEGWAKASNVQPATSGAHADVSGPSLVGRKDGAQVAALDDAVPSADPIGFWEYAESQLSSSCVSCGTTKWVSYARSDCELLEKAFKRGTSCELVMGPSKISCLVTFFAKDAADGSMGSQRNSATNMSHKIRREASIQELVQTAQSVIQECMKNPPEAGIPKYTQADLVLEILDRHWICNACSRARPRKQCSFPSTQSACFSCSPPRLEPFCPSNDSEARPVKLICGSWLLRYAGSDGKQKGISRRQELEQSTGTDAFLSVEDVDCKKPANAFDEVDAKVLNIISISYCWCTLEHPDPDGRQLRVIESILIRENEKYRRTFKDVGIFWDFGSLHQKDLRQPHPHRTSIEFLQFSEALREMSIWYAHQMIATYLLTESPAPGIFYDSRGWTLFERSCAEMFKPNKAGGNASTYPMIVDAHKESGRSLPLTPKLFAEQLAKRQFTSRGDKEDVVQLYANTFMRAIRGIQTFSLRDFQLQPGDGSRLASVMFYCASATEFDLAGMGITSTDMKAIASVVPNCTSIKTLNLHTNQIGDEGAKAIASALANHTSLELLNLSGNQIGDDGAMATASVLPNFISLRELVLHSNQIGDEGAQAIASALANHTSLQSLNLNYNAISDKDAIRQCAPLICRKIELKKDLWDFG